MFRIEANEYYVIIEILLKKMDETKVYIKYIYFKVENLPSLGFYVEKDKQN